MTTISESYLNHDAIPATQLSSILILRGVSYAGGGHSLAALHTCAAAPAMFLATLVAAIGQPIIHAEVAAMAGDVVLGD